MVQRDLGRRGLLTKLPSSSPRRQQRCFGSIKASWPAVRGSPTPQSFACPTHPCGMNLAPGEGRRAREALLPSAPRSPEMKRSELPGHKNTGMIGWARTWNGRPILYFDSLSDLSLGFPANLADREKSWAAVRSARRPRQDVGPGPIFAGCENGRDFPPPRHRGRFRPFARPAGPVRKPFDHDFRQHRLNTGATTLPK